MKAIVVLILLLGFAVPSVAYRESDELYPADVSFFFDSVRLDQGNWIYKLSPNTEGMIWRIRDGKSDVTGACKSGVELTVGRRASLEIKNRKVDLRIYWQFGVGVGMRQVVLRIGGEPKMGVPPSERSAMAMIGPGNRLQLYIVED